MQHRTAYNTHATLELDVGHEVDTLIDPIGPSI